MTSSNYKNVLLAMFFIGVTFGGRSGADAGAKVTFYKNAAILKTLTLSEMKKHGGTKEVMVEEPHDKSKRTYLAVDFQKLLDSVYGKEWRATKDVTFECLDKYRPVLKTATLVQYPNYLAYGIKGGAQFKVSKKNEAGQMVNLGPYYLVWDNLKTPAVKALNLMHWPYQLASVHMTF